MNIIWIAPDGDDATGTGTEDNPYLTIAKGASVFSSGDQIRLKSGTYSVSSTITFSSVTGSIMGDGGGAIITTDFDCRAGICFEDCSRVYVNNCTIKNYNVDTYFFGIYSNRATTRIGEISQCSFTNLISSDTFVSGIRGLFDVKSCYFSVLMGVGCPAIPYDNVYTLGSLPTANSLFYLDTCTDFVFTGITIIQGTSIPPTSSLFIFGLNLYDGSNCDRCSAEYGSWTESPNNEIGSPGGTGIYSDWYYLTEIEFQASDTYDSVNSKFHAFLPSIDVQPNESATPDTPHMYIYDSSSGAWTDATLPDPVGTHYRMFNFGCSSVNINGTNHAIFVVSYNDDEDLYAGTYYGHVYVHNGVSWVGYDMTAESTVMNRWKHCHMQTDGVNPIAYGNNDYSEIRKFNYSTHKWDLFVDLGVDWVCNITGIYPKLYVAALELSGDSTIHWYNGAAWQTPINLSASYPTFVIDWVDVPDASGKLYVVGSDGGTAFDPGMFLYYNGAAWSDRTSELPIPVGEIQVPYLRRIRAKDDNFIVIIAGGRYQQNFVYVYKDGAWTVTALEYDSMSGYAADYKSICMTPTGV